MANIDLRLLPVRANPSACANDVTGCQRGAKSHHCCRHTRTHSLHPNACWTLWFRLSFLQLTCLKEGCGCRSIHYSSCISVRSASFLSWLTFIFSALPVRILEDGWRDDGSYCSFFQNVILIRGGWFSWFLWFCSNNLMEYWSRECCLSLIC